MQNAKIKQLEKELEEYKSKLNASKEKVKVLQEILHEENQEMHNAFNMYKLYSSSIIREYEKLNKIIDCEIELEDESYAQEIQDYCVKHGIWIRPFGKLIYSIVAYTIDEEDLRKVIKTMIEAIKSLKIK